MSRTPVKPDDLRKVRNLEDVMELLADRLEWPITTDSLDDATFEYTPEELGIAGDQLPALESIRQLRPLEANQPWGIFFLEFAGPRLRVSPLRRLLRAFVTRSRANASKRGGNKTWALEDLLFVVATDSGDDVELHLVAFFEAGDSQPEIRSVPWRPRHSPTPHLRRVANELLPHLQWPDEIEKVDAWRSQWREAFKLRHGEAIQSSTRLSERMAETAIVLRTAIEEELGSSSPQADFRRLLEEVRSELVADVDEHRFADMCAQTLVYGMLTSRVTDPEGFGASPVLVTIPLANPFLSRFFEQVHDEVSELAVEDAHIDELIADLRVSNVEAILDQFGVTAHGGDPVIHFYEQFLSLYDSTLRIDAGAFYTPLPVVEFMVHMVDSVLRSEFALADGVADDASWQVVADSLGIAVPPEVDPVSPFISMLDPATGTGTFLVEWVARARKSYESNHSDAGWAERLTSLVLPAMHGFELMLAPYSIANLKMALEAHSQGIELSAGTVLLSDTLEHPSGQGVLEGHDDAIAVEGRRAAELKRQSRFTVCIGNPPYDREQRPAGGGKRKGGVVRYGVPGVPALLEDISKPMTQAGLGKHIKNIYNDYVYFWRWATWQTVEKIPGPGVVAFITAASYLDGVSMGGLRAHLRKTFDQLWIVDLGGDSRGASPEENVFDIRTPVAIGLGIRTQGGPSCHVRYAQVSGTREDKLAWLRSNSIGSIEWTDVAGSGMDTFLPLGTSEYWSWPALSDLFPWSHSGCQFKRTWPIAPDRSTLERRWKALQEGDESTRRTAFRETRDRTIFSEVMPLLGEGARLAPISQGGEWEACIQYAYRSFDRQWAVVDNRVADFPRPVLWRSAGSGQVFFTTLTSTRLGKGPAVFAAATVPEMGSFKGSHGAKDVFPLFRDARQREPNVTHGLLGVLESHLGRNVTVEELAAYVYGLTGTPALVERFADELGERAGPVRVPITRDPELFGKASSLGKTLLHIHTWGERGALEVDIPPVRSPIEVQPIAPTYPERFSYDAASETLYVGGGEVSPVTLEVWDFEVSGMRVLASWLGYRMAEPKGRRSSPLDEIGPTAWTFTPELLTVIKVLQHTVDLAGVASEVLSAIIKGPLIDPGSLPRPTDAQRKEPKL